MIVNTKGLKILMSKPGAVAVDLTPTAISAAKPAVVTVADVTTLNVGDVVSFSGTDFGSLDGKTFIVGTIDTGAKTFVVIGSDTSLETGSIGTTPVASVQDVSAFTNICAAEIAIDANTPGTISVATFCDVSAAIPSSIVEPGNMSFTGFLDITDAGYQALVEAEAAGTAVVVEIVFPQNGYLLAQGIISSVVFTEIPLDGAVKYVATLALSTKPVHIF